MASPKYTPGNFELIVKKAAVGKGLFSGSRIKGGACVLEYTGRPLDEVEKTTSRSRYLFDLGTGVTIDGWVPSNRARYINHSCNPNCEATVHRGRVWIHAIRDIAPGEELSYDYGETYFSAYIGAKCQCTDCAAKPGAEDDLGLQAAG